MLIGSSGRIGRAGKLGAGAVCNGGDELYGACCWQ